MQANQPENCSLCPKAFKNKTKLKVHQRQVHEVNPVPCDVCGELQFNEYCLKSHMQKHQVVTCDTCQEKFTHSKLDKFIRVYNYQIRDVDSEKAGEYLLKAVKHFNSYNLGKRD